MSLETATGKSFLQSVLPASREPDVAYNFIVFVGVRPLGDFRSVSGLSYTIPTVDVAEGGRPGAPHTLIHHEGAPGKWGQVTLEWGTPIWSLLYDWAMAVKIGQFYRRDVFIVQLKRNGWPTRIIRLNRAFPVEWKGADLKTTDSEWSMERLTLAYDSAFVILTRVSPGEVMRSAANVRERAFGGGGAAAFLETEDVDFAGAEATASPATDAAPAAPADIAEFGSPTAEAAADGAPAAPAPGDAAAQRAAERDALLARFFQLAAPAAEPGAEPGAGDAEEEPTASVTPAGEAE
jgi:phage tail-like protein